MQFTPRDYQTTIVNTAKMHNTMVVLPTGLGKTAIAMMLAQHRIKNYPTQKVLMVAPTKPLVEQHIKSFSENIEDVQSLGVLLNGTIKPEKRKELFENNSYIFSTPQTIENDLLSGRINLQDVCLLIVDEAHRATGDYAYVAIAEQYVREAKNERVLALTASPGSKKEDIQEILANCHIEKLEVRSTDDNDVKEYVQELDVGYVEVDLPVEIQELKKTIERVIKNRTKQLLSLGLITKEPQNKGQLLAAQRQLQHELRNGQPDPAAWRSISLVAEILKAQHAQELVETQGLQALQSYLDQMQRQAEKGQSKAVKNLMSDSEMRHLVAKTYQLNKRGIEHPKLIKLLSIVKLERTRRPNSKIIIFSQYRDMAKTISEKLKDAKLFVGQQKKGETGLSQKQQKAMLDEFRNSDFNILVATAVGEEGLDIPQVDLVLFYEPVPSAIRTIQRRGRTGRHDTGRVFVLIAKDTRDVAFRWVAHHKEKKMYRTLKEIKKTIQPKKSPQKSLLDIQEDSQRVEILADSREKASGVLKELKRMDVDLKLQSLPVGDYLLSKRVCVEFKYQDDFVNSLLDGRLFSQMRELVNYQRPIVMVQGSNWYSQRNIHPNAIRGALSAIAVSFGVPIIITQSDEDTAAMLKLIAEREAKGGISSPENSVTSRPTTQNQELASLVASIPGIGPVMAPRILEHFSTLRNLVSADVNDIQDVEGIGKKKAQQIVDFFDLRYNS